MANNSLIFYGKPQSFERYEISRNTIVQDEKNEPHLKPISIDNDILHYFFKDDYYYLELYGYANSYKAARPGVVIGVCIKSDEQIVVSKNNVSKLKSLLVQFKSIALSDDTHFNALRLADIDAFMTTIKNSNQVEGFLSDITTLHSKKPNHNNLTLLYLDDFENKIESLKNIICKYGDIYISADKNLFSDNLNMVVFDREAQKKFYVVKHNEIKSLEKPKPKPMPKPSQDNHSSVSTDQVVPDKSNDKVVKSTMENKKEFVSQEDFEEFKKRIEKRVKILICNSAVCVIVIITFFFSTSAPLDKWKTCKVGSKDGEVVTPEKPTNTPATQTPAEPTEPQSEKQHPSGDSGVGSSNNNGGSSSPVQTQITKITLKPLSEAMTDSWDLKPELFPKGTTTQLSEIKWEIEPDGYAYMDSTVLKVNKEKQKELTENKKIKVKAFLIKTNTLLAEQTYKIAKQETSQQSTTHTVIAGENFYDIARKYNMTNQRLIDLNPQIKNLDKLHAGQKINIEPLK